MDNVRTILSLMFCILLSNTVVCSNDIDLNFDDIGVRNTATHATNFTENNQTETDRQNIIDIITNLEYLRKSVQKNNMRRRQSNNLRTELISTKQVLEQQRAQTIDSLLSTMSIIGSGLALTAFMTSDILDSSRSLHKENDARTTAYSSSRFTSIERNVPQKELYLSIPESNQIKELLANLDETETIWVSALKDYQKKYTRIVNDILQNAHKYKNRPFNRICATGVMFNGEADVGAPLIHGLVFKVNFRRSKQ